MTDDATRYTDGSLAALKRSGCDNLRAFCLGCSHWHWLRIDDAIAKVGPGAALVSLARRVRCHCCGAKGAHIQPEDPPAIGTNGYKAWAIVRRDWLMAELDRFKDLDTRLPPPALGG